MTEDEKKTMQFVYGQNAALVMMLGVLLQSVTLGAPGDVGTGTVWGDGDLVRQIAKRSRGAALCSCCIL